MTHSQWAENVILVDADYIDRVAFDLIVNFERMIGRRIPPADLCRWVDCVALDGGMRPGEAKVQVVMLHSGDREKLENFVPAGFADELDGKAFTDAIAEFTLLSCSPEGMAEMGDFFTQSLTAVCSSEAVKRIMVVGNMEENAESIQRIAAGTEGKDITLFAMQPVCGRGFSGEILGYSLMNALGIRAEEIK